MKRIFVILLVTLLAFAMVEAVAETKIAVTGEGQTLVSADTAVINLGVSAQDKDVLEAQKSVNETIAAIRKALIEMGVDESCINTDYMNIYAVYDYSGEMERLTAYNANSTLAIKTTDMDKVGEIIDVSFAAGANTLNGISFSASDITDAKADALRMAVADAKVKGKILAEADGVTITGTELITEGGVYSYENSVGNFAAKEESVDGGTVVQAAKIVVSASVTVTYEAE